jgi:23S rRNA maturation-related 3'-5' exoribonuclease YhaM
MGEYMAQFLSPEKRAECENTFEELLLSTGREGTGSLLGWLREETDFFTAPASTAGHCCYDGGLLVHSLNVYKLLNNFNKNIKYERDDSIIIAGLLHDVCKVNFYSKAYAT